MKKGFIVIAIVAAAIVLSVALRGTFVHKRVVVSWSARVNELVAWVDKKFESGELKVARDDLGSYVFIGDYDVNVDFDRGRYGLKKGAAARVVVNDDRKPLSVVFIDSSHCGIAIALHAERSAEETFGYIPADLHLSSSRVGTFCVDEGL